MPVRLTYRNIETVDDLKKVPDLAADIKQMISKHLIPVKCTQNGSCLPAGKTPAAVRWQAPLHSVLAATR